jgi:spore coat polysaccharide biosynthesis protein SpsF
MGKTKPKVIASIEARMGSSRLPGKVLMDVAGQPALTRLVRRLRRSRLLDGIILATTTARDDDALEAWAAREGVACHRGSEEDVLGRVVGAQEKMGSDIVVEVTGDCTLLDPDIIDIGIETFFGNDCDVVTNVRRLSFPMGMDIQVFPLAKLAEVARTVADPAVREHVSLHFYEHPEAYRILHVFAPAPWRAPELRFQLDYREDLEFLNQVYRRLEPAHGDGFGIGAIMDLLRAEPGLAEINRHCVEKPVR